MHLYDSIMTGTRRSPSASERKRDPERTRERILEAALVEFGEHGFAGARISAIAKRAGVNQQLISYYFDGKEGLYRALNDRWQSISGDVNQAGLPLASLVNTYVDIGARERHWTRLLIWQMLSGEADPRSKPFHEGLVADLRRRQEAGEIAADLDPAYVALALFGAAMAPAVLPQFAENFTGLRPDSPEFVAAYQEQLTRLVARLASFREQSSGGHP
jgi:AcrR family transcriptional regulator